jgi:transcriptional antiterminator
MTKEQILQIPALKTQQKMTNKQLAKHFKVSLRTIQYWCDKLRERDYHVPKDNKKSLLD